MKLKPKLDTYKGKPWRNMDEYFELANRYKLFGADLEEELKKINKHKIPMPVIKPPKGY